MTDKLFRKHLEFLLTSPSLLATTDTQPVFHSDQLIPASLLESTIDSLVPLRAEFEQQLKQRRSGRLGIYYEALWGFVLRHLPDTTVLAANLPVRDTNRTLGEFDLICEHQNKRLHLELAIKFYLGVPATPTDDSSVSLTRQWVGPGLRDRLDIKLERLLGHQLGLSATYEGIATLNSLMGESGTTVNAKALVQGRLFYPWQTVVSPPAGIACNHQRGVWITLAELGPFLDSQPATATYQCLQRSEWLAPVFEPGYSSQQLSDYFSDQGGQFSPVMICMQAPDTNDDLFFFVVPDSWPEAARQSVT
ncbi:DUF1853 family protein [Endozoicomonadaceae bacterium StTr2]